MNFEFLSFFRFIMIQPKVAIFGGEFTEEQIEELKKHTEPHFYPDDTYVFQVLTFVQPDILVSISEGGNAAFPKMCQMHIIDKNRWLHYPNVKCLFDEGRLNGFYFCFINDAVTSLVDKSLISIFTTSYKSRHYIQRVYNSLMDQTNQHWEWVIYDDTDGEENWQTLKDLRAKDPKRIRIFRADGNSGVIGNVKQIASSLCRGEILVEMDHDDELTPQALEYLLQASKDFPDAGFFFSDFSEVTEKWGNLMYGEGFSLGYGSYRQVWREDKKRWIFVVASSPINYINIRWLVGCPNHLRAWRKKTLQEIGGWNHRFHVADDFDVMIRTFLHTKMVRIPCLGYYQYRNDGGDNYTFIRNREIQKLGWTMTRYWNQKISKRFLELTGKDPCVTNWNNVGLYGKYWEDDKVTERVDEIYKINGRNPEKPLVSIVLVSENDKPKLLAGIRKVVELTTGENGYDEFELMVVGNQCQVLEWTIAEICANRHKGISPDWCKKYLAFWSCKKTVFASCLNYAAKMIHVGEITMALSCDDLENVPAGFLKTAVQKLKEDPELEYLVAGQKRVLEELQNKVTYRLSQHVVHRTSLYHKNGYWKKNEDLLDVWAEAEHKMELVGEELDHIIIPLPVEAEVEKKETEAEAETKEKGVEAEVEEEECECQVVDETVPQDVFNADEAMGEGMGEIWYFIINHDRCSVLKKQLESLKFHQDEIAKVVIVDHNSTYGPTLDFYQELKDVDWVDVVEIKDKYYGKKTSEVPDNVNLARVGYQHMIDVIKKYQSEYDFDYFAKCDPDCEVPPIEGYFNHLVKVSQKFKDKYQVGPCLKTDDIPDDYPMKKLVIENEQHFLIKLFEKNINIDNQDYTIFVPVTIDGTLSIFHKKFLNTLDPFFCDIKRFPAIRVGGEFELRHLDWYICEKDDEVLYMRNTSGMFASHSTNWMIGIDTLEIKK